MKDILLFASLLFPNKIDKCGLLGPLSTIIRLKNNGNLYYGWIRPRLTLDVTKRLRSLAKQVKS